MKFSFFYHYLVSDWNHGNAHFLRGVVSELMDRGHDVAVYEPADGWSRSNLLHDHGETAIEQFHRIYPHLSTHYYQRETLDLAHVADDSDVIFVHEWNEPWLVNGLGELHNRAKREGANSNFSLLFHDTHHRAVSDAGWIRRFRLDYYDGVLAFGEVLRKVYQSHGWNDYVWTLHEAADTSVFYPHRPNEDHPRGDVAWIGNWGDDERSHELESYLFKPIRKLSLSCHIYGVRYPADILETLRRNGVEYGNWLPNFQAPEVFANHSVTVHIPRRLYADVLPGIPTIRPFEAMACGIPLICAPWVDSEQLFSAGDDYLIAHNSEQMQTCLRQVLNDREFADHMARQALSTVRRHHTCGHRVEQLLHILASNDLAGLCAVRPVKDKLSEQATNIRR